MPNVDESSAPPPVSSDVGPWYIGLMSGTSLDGVDGILVRFDARTGRQQIGAEAYVPFPQTLRAELLTLQAPDANEIHREALAANRLAQLYAACCRQLLERAQLTAGQIRAIGVHGQTIRHRPGEFDGIGYTRQINQPALLAELTGIDVVADFRSRDVAAGGQGAPLVPAFHASVFGSPSETRVICNIGGISNLTILPAASTSAAGHAIGFDCGPGNALLDGWAMQHLGTPYDANGQWAATGKVAPSLLADLLADPYFVAPPPKSTGRDLFNATWLTGKLSAFGAVAPADVQATLLALTVRGIADATRRYAPDCRTLFVCGGGAHNTSLMAALRQDLAPCAIDTTGALGIPPQQVEALAFAWLAQRCVERQPGNLPRVTGASGPRVLGAIYPA